MPPPIWSCKIDSGQLSTGPVSHGRYLSKWQVFAARVLRGG